MASGSRYFDGTNDVLGPATWTFPGYPFTMEVWCNWPPATTGEYTLVSYNNSMLPYRHYINFVTDSTKPEIGFNVGSYRSFFANGTANWATATSDTQVWLHIVGVWTAANSRSLYINGTHRNTDTTNVNVTAPSKLYVGANVAAAYYDGNIARVSVRDVALNANEILAAYHGGHPANTRPPSLKGHWPIHGLQSPEPNLTGGLGSLAVAGATAVDGGPPVNGPDW